MLPARGASANARLSRFRSIGSRKSGGPRQAGMSRLAWSQSSEFRVTCVIFLVVSIFTEVPVGKNPIHSRVRTMAWQVRDTISKHSELLPIKSCAKWQELETLHYCSGLSGLGVSDVRWQTNSQQSVGWRLGAIHPIKQRPRSDQPGIHIGQVAIAPPLGTAINRAGGRAEAFAQVRHAARPLALRNGRSIRPLGQFPGSQHHGRKAGQCRTGREYPHPGCGL